MTIAALWRYPVETLAGEPIQSAVLTALGIPGDRAVHVRGPEGVRTSRRHHHLLGLRGTLSLTGRALINGMPWDSSEALDAVRQAAGPDAWLVEDDGYGRFDILPLLVATDGAVRAFGRDVRRLRPRCPMTTVDPDTLERDPEVLRDIARRFHGRLALNADVTRSGTIHVGDEVRLVMPNPT